MVCIYGMFRPRRHKGSACRVQVSASAMRGPSAGTVAEVQLRAERSGQIVLGMTDRVGQCLAFGQIRAIADDSVHPVPCVFGLSTRTP